MEILPLHHIDFYKSGHYKQYVKGTGLVFVNMTPRASMLDDVDEVVFFVLQYFIKEYLIKQWNKNFFERDIEDILALFTHRMDTSLGKGAVGTDHIRALHKLGYMPLQIMALPEGSLVPIRVPMLVMWNTLPEFYWLPNYIETIMSTTIWGPCTSATMALRFRKVLDEYQEKTDGNDVGFVPYQGHDFGSRGMFGFEAGCMSGAGHLLSFVGTDTVGAIDFVEQYYKIWDDPVGRSIDPIGEAVPATEHSVMCLGGDGINEIETIRRLITETYPTGKLSAVCDTWDLWKVVTEYLPMLKDEIMARDGQLIIRPDSGVPADILCGKPFAYIDDKHDGNWETYEAEMKAHGEPLQIEEAVYKGLIQCLYETFGGTETEKGYKKLDSHIGAIYGDSITLDRCKDICARLERKGYASTNVVFGIGSFTYQYTTRDVYGFAIKATYAEVDGEPREIYKKPKTDNGMKNSAKGLTAVNRASDGKLFMNDRATWDQVLNCALELVFKDGVLVRNEDFSDIRETLRGQL